MDRKKVSRRSFVCAAGAVGALAVSGNALRNKSIGIQDARAEEDSNKEAPAGETGVVPNTFIFNQETCIGCKTCVSACQKGRGFDGFSNRRVYNFAFEDGQETITYFTSVSCNHCGKPACAEACPTTAMHKDEETGLVLVDESKCIACGYCALACPYNAPQVVRDLGQSVKCDGCNEATRAGHNPFCVDSCPTESLQLVSLEETLEMSDAVMADTAPLPDPMYTVPALMIKPHPDARKFSDVGEVTNSEEVR